MWLSHTKCQIIRLELCEVESLRRFRCQDLNTCSSASGEWQQSFRELKDSLHSILTPESGLEIHETSLKKQTNKRKKKDSKDQEQTNKTPRPQKNDSTPTLQYFKILIHPETDFSSVPRDELFLYTGADAKDGVGCVCF